MTRVFFAAIVAGSLFLLSGLLPVASEERGAATEKDSVLLGAIVEDGVQASARLSIRQAEANRPTGTEAVRIEVTLADQKTGQAIEEGFLSVLVIDPDKETQFMPTPMTLEKGRFTADVTLSEPGEYRIRVIARLPDKRTRRFDFAYTWQ